MDESKEEDKVIDLAKVLFDRTKIKIIKELNQQPQYGFGLAKQLNLSSPTISYHISKLSDLGLITAQRNENKIFYQANQELIEEALKSMSDMLIAKER
ncbi:ArsR/SmtB family transcription factor [Oceanobacillus jeddahense]|uniref:Winged helix-turn-helix domain-containing protein n=1 Tax=Oceanobacillus jeddahense TaxID=1462527 RepID=A0ABY5JWX0_9BACI|nr:winged helix-turn-helix domain-containing protein [Oceanobacillus jeddahense]UUI04740.1 winged helix-turn-helix domain-containing protein [Oceanobacillus jeddahense]